MPRVWSQIYARIGGFSTPQIIEEINVLAGTICRYGIEDHIFGTPSMNVTLQGQAAPYYELKVGESTNTAPGKAEILQPDARTTQTGLTIIDPRKDDRAVHVAKEEGEESAYASVDMKCFNCHRSGHMSRDCKQPRKSALYNQRSAGKPEQVTLKGTLYHEQQTPQFGKRVREQFRKTFTRGRSGGKFAGKKRSGDRAYVTGAPEADEGEDTPSMADVWNDDEVDRELSEMFAAMEEDQQDE